mgnify:FL=1
MLFNKNHDRILLIKQYDMTDYILLGWLCVSRGKCRDNCGREIDEEFGLRVTSLTFNTCQYYERSNS